MGIEYGVLFVIYVAGIFATFLIMMLVSTVTFDKFDDNMVAGCAILWPIAIPLLLVVLLIYILRKIWEVFLEVIS